MLVEVEMVFIIFHLSLNQISYYLRIRSNDGKNGNLLNHLLKGSKLILHFRSLIYTCVFTCWYILVPLTPRRIIGYCKGILLWFPKTSQAEKWAGVLVISLTANMHATAGTWTQKSLRSNRRNDWHGFFQGVSD